MIAFMYLTALSYSRQSFRIDNSDDDGENEGTTQPREFKPVTLGGCHER